MTTFDFSRLQAWLAPHPWLWTVLVLTALVVAAWLADWITRKVLLRGIRKLLQKTVMHAIGQDRDLHLVVIPRLAHVVPALVLFAGMEAVPGLPPMLVTVVRALCQAWVILTVALSVSAALEVINREYDRRPDAHLRPIKGYLQVARIIVFVLAGISIFATLVGAKFVHVLTGLGAMTAVTMLIFQDTILSFVASVQISSDGRIRVGDWIEMPSQSADGDVLDIALHTVTVQNWDKTITTIPTKKFVTDAFKNWRGMSECGGRRIKRSLLIDQKSVRFLDDADVRRLRRFHVLEEYLQGKQDELTNWNAEHGRDATAVDARRLTNFGSFRAYAERYLRSHPLVRQDMSLMVRQLQPGGTGIPLEIYCFSSDIRWVAYEGVQADIFDHLLAILPEFGLRLFQSSSDAPLSVALVDARSGEGGGKTG